VEEPVIIWLPGTMWIDPTVACQQYFETMGWGNPAYAYACGGEDDPNGGFDLWCCYAG
jgi:hypothetical protein